MLTPTSPAPDTEASHDSAFHAQANAIIVLGGGVRRAGTLTEVSRARVERALELYRAGVAPRLIMTGKCGVFFRKPISEAAAMAAYAQARAVPASALLIEEDARDTFGNACFTRDRYLTPNRWHRVRVVTSAFHQRRAEALFRAALGRDYECSFTVIPSGLERTEIALRLLEPFKALLPPIPLPNKRT